MLTKTKFVIAAVLVLSAASAALAKNDDDGPTRGGFDIGPLGQCMNPPDCGGKHGTSAAYYGNAANTFGFVPWATQHKHHSAR
jgi:hypothetical protein